MSGLEPRVFTGSTNLAELGLDSLSSISLIVAIEDSTGVQISCSERIGLSTIDEAVKLILVRAKNEPAHPG